jgi:SAM-dependent methyltransferase
VSFVPTDLFSLERLPDRQRWDQRYASMGPDERTEPTSFLVACLPHLPASGHALDVAAGTGRNSVALAAHGLTVDAVDVSWQGLRRAMSLAWQRQASINPVVLDLQRGWLPPRRYDVVVNSFFLLRDLLPPIRAALKPGGWLVFEALTLAQLEITPQHGTDRRYLLRPGELHRLFEGFAILSYWEGIEGSRATARLLARKPDQAE